MIKYFCDFCEREITPLKDYQGKELLSALITYSKQIVVQNDNQMKAPTEGIRTNIQTLCDECIKKINESLIKKEAEKVSEKVGEKKEDENTNNKV